VFIVIKEYGNMGDPYPHILDSEEDIGHWLQDGSLQQGDKIYKAELWGTVSEIVSVRKEIRDGEGLLLDFTEPKEGK